MAERSLPRYLLLLLFTLYVILAFPWSPRLFGSLDRNNELTYTTGILRFLCLPGLPTHSSQSGRSHIVELDALVHFFRFSPIVYME
jgi:hypothetical protein